MNPLWSYVKVCEGRVTWAIGVHPKTRWSGTAASRDEALRHVARLRERLVAEMQERAA